MKVVIVAGSPASGKTSLLLAALERLRADGARAGVYKVDAVASADEAAFAARGWPARGRVAGDVCPDHEAMVVLGEAWDWAVASRFDLLVVETAGLCDRCSPFLERALAVFVVSGLSSIAAPGKQRAMVEAADVLVLTRAEMTSPAERQVFLEGLRAINPRAQRIVANGLTGEGAWSLAARIQASPDVRLRDLEPLRSVLPTGYCHFCQGTGSGHG